MRYFFVNNVQKERENNKQFAGWKEKVIKLNECPTAYNFIIGTTIWQRQSLNSKVLGLVVCPIRGSDCETLWEEHTRKQIDS